MFSQFQHNLFKTYIIAFGQFFQNIQIVRADAGGAETQRFRVPIEYGPKEKWDYRLKQDPEFERSVALVLPRISYQITGINYDSSRKLTTLNQIIKPVSTGRRNTIYVPVPYSLKFSLSIIARNQSDGFQIVEQILPYFTPDLTFALATIPEMGIVDQIPLIIDSVTEEDTYDSSDFGTQRLITWNLGFDMRVYFYGPQRKSSTVQEIIVNLYQSGIDGISDFDALLDESGVVLELEDGSGPLVEEDTANTMINAQSVTTIDVFTDPAVTITTEEVAGGVSNFSLYRSTVINDGAIAYWRFGETSGTIASDETTHFNGTYQTGAILGQPGALADGNFAMGCDGASSPMVILPSSQTMDFGDGSFTIEFWMNFDAGENYGDDAVLTLGNPSNVGFAIGFNFGQVSGLYSSIELWDTSLTYVHSDIRTSQYFGVPNVWYHVVAVIDRENKIIMSYVNGSLTQSLGGSIPSNYGSVMSTELIEAGYNFKGLLDELAIYNYALTAAQIETHYALRTWKP